MMRVYSISDLVLAQKQAHRKFDANSTFWQALSNLAWYYNARFELALILPMSRSGNGLPEFDDTFYQELKVGFRNLSRYRS